MVNDDPFSSETDGREPEHEAQVLPDLRRALHICVWDGEQRWGWVFLLVLQMES